VDKQSGHWDFCHLSFRGHARWVSGLPKLLFCCCSAIENRGSLSLLLIMKVMFWHFVSDSHKVLTALMFVLTQWCCCSGFRQTFCIQVVTRGVLKGYMFRVQQTPNHYYQCRPLCLRHSCLPVQAQNEMNWNLSTQACCSLTEDSIDLFDWLHLLSATQYHDWVFPLLPEMWQNLRRQMFVQCFTWNFWQIIMFLSTPSVRSWWSQWEVMAACCCCSWWRCWSNILWVTLIRLWLLIVMLPSKCCGVLSGILEICSLCSVLSIDSFDDLTLLVLEVRWWRS
jgi:hypothetical protein